MRLFIGLILLSMLSPAEVMITINITNVQTGKGALRLAIFDTAANFQAEENAVFAKVIPLDSKEDVSLRVPLSADQSYGVAVFHDINGNGKLDRNLMGIPKEPYAFSNNPAAKWQAPTFAEISFLPRDATAASLDLKLLKWGDR